MSVKERTQAVAALTKLREKRYEKRLREANMEIARSGLHHAADPVPPDPEKQNSDRARWSSMALYYFIGETGSDLEDAVSDLIADLGHWCDRNGMNLKEQISRAEEHYDAETNFKGKQFNAE